MNPYTIGLLAVALARLLTIFISRKNEQKLKAAGACEFGKANTKLLIRAHFAFYGLCLCEGLYRGFHWDRLSISGLILLTASIAVLYYVIYELRGIWTVKLIIGPSDHHTLNKGFLFRWVKHPNYYLNIIPELIAVGLIFHAWLCLSIGLPFYLVLLASRIRREERLMSEKFTDY